MTIEEAITQLDYLKNFKTDWDIAICIGRRKEKETLSRQEMIEGDMEKIREVMDCDSDVEIKCKMIFCILFPHYFEKPEPESPCDLCIYNPPSSCDGKPCTMCPATTNMAIEQKPETVTEFADRCRECGAKYGKLLKQEPKTGHWIADVFVDECSVCGEQTLFFEDQRKNFCPNCGAKMVEPQ